jgi:hypothetical protein
MNRPLPPTTQRATSQHKTCPRIARQREQADALLMVAEAARDWVNDSRINAGNHLVIAVKHLEALGFWEAPHHP